MKKKMCGQKHCSICVLRIGRQELQNVRNAGYDVLEEANKLERFYVEASAR
ncbi:MAG: hypothetical protein ACLUUO_09925 [Sellimonas intestinalis]